MRARSSRLALDAAAPGWPDTLRARVSARGQRLAFREGQRLFGPGDVCQGFIVVLSGSVRVEHVGPTGRTIVLYRIAPGETCVMTTACLMTGEAYSAWGVAESAVDALALSPPAFEALIAEDKTFRAMAFGVFADRMQELVEVIDELLLHRVDLRLAEWLAARGPEIAATHQSVAAELGTAREVVSRILKDFERRGFVALGRGAITITDADALKNVAAQR
jgi:CRP/FNR family transcriptional regulator